MNFGEFGPPAGVGLLRKSRNPCEENSGSLKGLSILEVWGQPAEDFSICLIAFESGLPT
jgi:hypothetical protein